MARRRVGVRLKTSFTTDGVEGGIVLIDILVSEDEVNMSFVGLSNIRIGVAIGSSVKFKGRITSCCTLMLDPEPYFLKNPAGLDAIAAR